MMMNDTEEEILNLNVNVIKSISEGCCYLEEFEFQNCAMRPSCITDDLLSDIKHMKSLRKLTLHDIPRSCSGKFLIDVCKSCENLSSLKILAKYTVRGPEKKKLNEYICLALPHAKSLLQFRCDLIGLNPLDGMLELLPEKVQTVFLKSHLSTPLSEHFLDSFLRRRKHLKFLCIIFYFVKKKVLQEIHKNLMFFWKGSNKIVVLDNNEPYQNHVLVPSVYVHEIINKSSQICGLDLSKVDFE